MTWFSDAEHSAASYAAAYEAYIQGDKYLRSRRGQWTERFGALADFENHFDVHFTQDFFYDKVHGRKIQFIADLLNAGNLLNRSWGMYNSASWSIQALQVVGMTQTADGNYVPTYKFDSPQSISYNDFYSRWRLQFGLRLTF